MNRLRPSPPPTLPLAFDTTVEVGERPHDVVARAAPAAGPWLGVLGLRKPSYSRSATWSTGGASVPGSSAALDPRSASGPAPRSCGAWRRLRRRP
jgi:hypothetical protein